MTDRRRKHPKHRIWRATAGRVCPMMRRLRARSMWEWWTARGVVPRWQLLLVYVLVLTASAVGMDSNRTLARQSKDTAVKAQKNAAITNSALCALRADLERRVATSEQFLREHPDGVAGIPAKTIRDGITNQKRTIKALSGLRCSPVK